MLISTFNLRSWLIHIETIVQCPLTGQVVRLGLASDYLRLEETMKSILRPLAVAGALVLMATTGAFAEWKPSICSGSISKSTIMT